MKNYKKAPDYLSHTPIVTVDYKNIDANAGDAKFLSIGYAQWTKEFPEEEKDFSAKIWRKTNGKWSRQSEELPLWRVIDLATLVVATIAGRKSDLEEFLQDPDKAYRLEQLKDYLKENSELFSPKISKLRRVIAPEVITSTLENAPNLFDFATSELSQDALFAWLMQWADQKYKEKDEMLYNLAQEFVKLLVGDDHLSINTINVGRQWQNIDIWAEINDDVFLVIEDKTNTTIHDNQLERYKGIVEDEYKGKRNKLYFSYVKTGNEPLSVLRRIEQVGYRPLTRKHIIRCLEKYTGNNAIVCDYRERLKSIETETQSYKNLPVSKWGWYAWQGFYTKLDTKIGLTSWEYVPNQSGGFLGAWWHFRQITGIEEAEMYLQFEEKKMCFKVSCPNKDNCSELRQFQYEKLMLVAKQMNHAEITKPARFGAGCCMTIAVVDSNYIFGEGTVDFDDLISKLKDYQRIVDICCDKKND